MVIFYSPDDLCRSDGISLRIDSRLRRLARMTVVTAAITNSMPIACPSENGSWNTATPTTTAVTGSIDPRMAVVVEPMCLIAIISVRLETRVGTRPNMPRFMAD